MDNGDDSVRNPRKAFNIKVPFDEAQAVLDAADRLGVSATMLFRIWIRQSLMNDPIILPDKD